MVELIDTHAHLEEIEDLPAALEGARQAGVRAIVAVGSGQQSNRRALEIAALYPGFVYPGLGLHPWELGKISPAQVDECLAFIEARIDGAVAVGEIGLDYNKRVLAGASKDHQKQIMARLFAIAVRRRKPVIIHSRYAWKDALHLAKSSGIEKAVFHWFTGFSSVLREILDAGYYVSATPAAEYHEEHRRAIKEAPLEKLLLETDSPVSYGREDRFAAQPSDVVRSLKAVALLKGLEESEVASRTTRNAADLFGISVTPEGA